MLENLQKSFEKIEMDLRNLNRFMYENPEMGLEEFKAMEGHCELLEKNGFKATKNYMDIETAFLGEYDSGKSGATIAYLAEYDALPGIGHGCGHNILGVTSSGAGILLKEYVDLYGGKVLVVGTPAEETNGAKVEMAKKGAFNHIDVAMIVHPTGGKKHQRSGTSQAMEALEFTFRGKTAHAAGAPHEGINALDGVITFFNGVNAMRQQILETDRVHGIITNGGEAANIIPDLAVANFYVRSRVKKELEVLKEKVVNCAKGAALASGTQLEIRNYETSFMDLVTNKNLMDIYEESLNEIGITEENIENSGSAGSTDAGDVSQVCPTIHPYFPLYKDVNGHSRELADCTVEEGAYQGMKEAIFALVLTGKKILENEELLKNIKKEFKEYVEG